MTAISPSPRLVLADRVLPRGLVTDLALVAGGALFTALLAQVTIPMFPVPITGQTLAVLLVGATLGAVRGGASLLLYALLGLAGLPFYAPQDDGSHLTGLAALAAPSFGYIIGFIPAAAIVGWLSERTWDRKFFKALATFAGGSLVVFAFGLPWLAVVTGATLQETLEWGLYPFIIGGIVKAIIAAILLPAAWWGADKLAARRN
ncbi:biotin transporter BioY [Protaetiibacter mangrovi]|uniref:Biotin transporter n=1 Tax=Protaetiibacter mangrovi TaxID=2970926 RepID=A0ABT1ZC37_9MICO|nr:biotin transporter BioY [Protaetiibacter mangrovi]MCS0498267.1 biotin transporter BioY [Protaetiibacter mangrovi]TPX04388.1 biotin transporter BioY [Schumannella luteola]